jgi:hypothetical protein
MKNGSTKHDFDSIAELLRQQNAALEVLLSHFAHTEAALLALTVKILPEENLAIAKRLKDHMQSQIYAEMMDEIQRKLDDQNLATA